MKSLVIAVAFAIGTLSLAPAFATEPGKAITVKDAWLRATPKSAPVAGGYATITNSGTAPDRLIAASLPSAPKGEIHTMSMEKGVMHMSRLEGGLVIAPGASVTLRPNGEHLMFLNPTAPLRETETVAGTLTFEKAGTIPVTFAVAGMAAKTAPGTMGHAGMGAMDGMDMTKH